MPNIAINQIIPNIVHPSAVSYSLNVHNANGVYEPAISNRSNNGLVFGKLFLPFFLGLVRGIY